MTDAPVTPPKRAWWQSLLGYVRRGVDVLDDAGLLPNPVGRFLRKALDAGHDAGIIDEKAPTIAGDGGSGNFGCGK